MHFLMKYDHSPHYDYFGMIIFTKDNIKQFKYQYYKFTPNGKYIREFSYNWRFIYLKNTLTKISSLFDDYVFDVCCFYCNKEIDFGKKYHFENVNTEYGHLCQYCFKKYSSLTKSNKLDKEKKQKIIKYEQLSFW